MAKSSSSRCLDLDLNDKMAMNGIISKGLTETFFANQFSLKVPSKLMPLLLSFRFRAKQCKLAYIRLNSMTKWH